MSFEPSSVVPAGEHAAQPSPAPDGRGDTGVTPALRLQILATEHWSLLATRSLAWNEIWARGGMLLSALSGAIVALALVGQGTGFGSSFALFGIVILPVVLFIGVTTYLRMSTSNQLEAMTVIGMNRIRAAYLELAPDLEKYLVTAAHDDWRGVAVTMGRRAELDRLSLTTLLSATPVVVMVINAVVAGAITGLTAIEVGLTGPVPVVLAVIAFVVVLAIHLSVGRRNVRRVQDGLVTRFPGQPAEPTW